jgi:tRNA-splicing ligase RtcB (3'-phosphate/5'-hydroxy nucleic acid ligase)
MAYEEVEGGNIPIKAWTIGVPFEHGAKVQLRYTTMVPVVGPYIAVMPDVHAAIGSTVGSVVPTRQAIIPAAVGVDIGCGMMAVRTSLTSHQVSESAQDLFESISKAVPHGGERGKETGNWSDAPTIVADTWKRISPKYRELIGKHGKVSSRNAATQLGTLGGGNHFIEVCIDQDDRIWFMLHSGSRGAGNRIGEFYIELAKKEMEHLGIRLPNRDLAYLKEGTENFDDYVEALHWAQEYAKLNREIMMENLVKSVRKELGVKFVLTDEAVNCHHNYVQKEQHFGEELYITRKGAVSARKDELGIIPGSMGARSFIVRGLGNADSFHSCSHGAGRVMARGVAKQSITLDMHRKATEGVACRKDRDVIDESPAAYKDIDVVMSAQKDLVEIVHTLKQIVCVKG